MITDDDVFALFERADPARTTDARSIDVVGDLDALRTRSNNVTYIEPAPTTTEPSEHRRLLFLGVAAAVIALVVAGLVLLTGGDDPNSQTPATTPETTPAATPNTTTPSAPTTPLTSPPAPTPAAAVEQATALLVSFKERALTAVESKLADGFRMQIAFFVEPMEEASTTDWLGLNNQVATAVNYVDPACSVVDERPSGTVVECQTVMELAVHQITNDFGVPTTVTITVNGDGVVAMDSRYSNGFAEADLLPFEEWRDANRPGELDVDTDPQTFADSELYAEAQSALLDDWITFGLDAVQATYADLNDGNVNAFLARFEPGRDVLGVDSDDAPVVWPALAARGTRHEPSNCGPAGMKNRVLTIACDVVVSNAQYDLAGLHLSGRYEFGVGPDGIVKWNDNTVDWAPMHELHKAFEAWMAQNRPDIHGEINWIDLGSPNAIYDDHTVLDTSFAEFIAASDVYPLGG